MCVVSVLVSKRLAVLDAMSAVTQSTDMDNFMQLTGLPSSEVLKTLKELSRDEFVTRTKHGYAIAEKGLLALAALRQLPDDKAFYFYLGVDQPAGASARNLREFYTVVETVAAESLDFHSERGDFENWVRTSVKDDVFAGNLAGLLKEGLKGEALRKQVLLGLLARFGEDVLLRGLDT
jgi:hypothetical protein